MSDEPMNIYQKLQAIQTELKAPKNQEAKDFKTGKVRYKYRSCEDILEALKPLLAKYGCTLTIEDYPVEVQDRIYIQAIADLRNIDNPTETIQNRALARETLDNGRMDAAQITGAASSYARKYALNGLFLIDDTRDVDTDEYREEKVKAAPKTEVKQEKKTEDKKPEENSERLTTAFQINRIKEICDENDLQFDEAIAKAMSMKEASDFINKYAKEDK